MNKQTFEGLHQIPKGKAGSRITEGCLVLEGGAFRGLYTQGFLDALMLHDINFRCVIGVSAGALAGMNYVSGQIGRSARINIGSRNDSRFVGWKAVLHAHSILDVGFVTEERGILEPFDHETFLNPERRFLAVSSNCMTGEADYFEKGVCDDIMLAIRASSTLPFVSPTVMIGGAPHLDGCCTCHIPYRWAIDEGYEKIVVIKTRQPDFRVPEEETKGARTFYRRYPKLAESLAKATFQYNRQYEEIEALHNEGRILRFAPSEPVTVTRLEKDTDKLWSLYELGRRDCLNGLETLKAYLDA
ncbi:MAG: patatin family protein [Lachnospiraceae bacterium]|nr:patatin family protein [Lachnospiraceae bacterium]